MLNMKEQLNKKLSEEEIEYFKLEIEYEKALGREYNWKNAGNNRDLYPHNWSSNKNYSKKTEILNEAIKRRCLISETEQYLCLIEGIRKNNKDEESEER